MEDNRASNIAGVYIDEIKVQEPPFDRTEVVQEFVGEAWFREFFYEPASAVTGSRIEEFVDDAINWLGESVDRIAIEYNLVIRARSKRTARAKARSYIRFVNPFSAGVIKIEEINIDKEVEDMIGDIDPLVNFYRVKVFVAK